MPPEPRPAQAAKVVAKDVVAVIQPPAQPPPVIFKTLGYVDKGEGQIEAIILQENQIQVVHLGDLIAEKFRVTKVSPDEVDAIDVTTTQSAMTKPGEPELEASKASASTPSPPLPAAAPPAEPEALSAAREDALPSDSQMSNPNDGARAVQAQNVPATPPNSAEKETAFPQGNEPSAKTSAYIEKDDVRVEKEVAVGEDNEQAVKPLGYVQKANGKVEAVVADGDSVRLVLEASGTSMAEVSPPSDVSTPRGQEPSLAETPYLTHDAANVDSLTDSNEATVAPASVTMVSYRTVSMKPLGYVVKANGEFAAILSHHDEIYIVSQGDRFGGRYRAVNVSADAVEAVEDPVGQTHPSAAPVASSGLLAISARKMRSPFEEGCARCMASPPESPTLVFQTLGYVESQDGEVQAVVADGSQVYLVKQGETFAGQYLATSVDPVLVLAVRVSPRQNPGRSPSGQTESGAEVASNGTYGYWRTRLPGRVNAQALHQVGASGNPLLTDLGVSLLRLPLAGFDFPGHIFTADHDNGGF